MTTRPIQTLTAHCDLNANTNNNPSQTRLPGGGHLRGKRIEVSPWSAPRKKWIKIKVNDAEHAALSAIGQKDGRGISAAIRDHLLDRTNKRERREAVRELARLVRNMNLIATEVRRYDGNRAVEIISWLMVIEREIDRAIEHFGKGLR